MRALSLLALLALALPACSAQEPTPEQEIRALLDDIERASRERDLARLRDAISPDYRDEAGRTREDIENILRFQYLRQRAVYLLTRIDTLEVISPERAELVVLGAMAGSPFEGLEALRKLRADVYRFDLSLAREDNDWRVIRGGWRPASVDDLMSAAPFQGDG